MDAAPQLPVHSLLEACLYVVVKPCAACGSGPMQPAPDRLRSGAGPDGLAVPIICSRGDTRAEIAFAMRCVNRDEMFPVMFRGLPVPPTTINPTGERSLVLDVADWLTLHSMLVETARAASTEGVTLEDRRTIRQLQIEAGECLDEALKFYEADNELPVAEAFFSDTSRNRFLERPALFARQRLLDLRGKLPIARYGD